MLGTQRPEPSPQPPRVHTGRKLESEREGNPGSPPWGGLTPGPLSAPTGLTVGFHEGKPGSERDAVTEGLGNLVPAPASPPRCRGTWDSECRARPGRGTGDDACPRGRPEYVTRPRPVFRAREDPGFRWHGRGRGPAAWRLLPGGNGSGRGPVVTTTALPSPARCVCARHLEDPSTGWTSFPASVWPVSPGAVTARGSSLPPLRLSRVSWCDSCYLPDAVCHHRGRLFAVPLADKCAVSPGRWLPRGPGGRACGGR